MEKKLKALENKPTPEYFKVPREAGHQITAKQLELFPEYLEPDMTADGAVTQVINISNIKEVQLRAFTTAAQQILYNQSVLSGHAEENTGIERNSADEYSKNTSMATGTSVKKYGGTIIVSLYELCQKAYGTTTPDNKQKKEMMNLIEHLDEVKLEIRYPNGDVLRRKMCAVMDEYRRAKDEARFYRIFFHPIFCENMKSFAIYPQDIMTRLISSVKRLTSSHFILLNYLALQDKRKPCTMLAENFLNRTGLSKSYKKNKGRTMRKVENLCTVMEDVKIAKSHEIRYTKSGAFKEVVFHLNPDFANDKGKKETTG